LPPILGVPKPNEPLLLYMASTLQVVSAVLVAEREEDPKVAEPRATQSNPARPCHLQRKQIRALRKDRGCTGEAMPIAAPCLFHQHSAQGCHDAIPPSAKASPRHPACFAQAEALLRVTSHYSGELVFIGPNAAQPQRHRVHRGVGNGAVRFRPALHCSYRNQEPDDGGFRRRVGQSANPGGGAPFLSS
jgi:hypothetical protein